MIVTLRKFPSWPGLVPVTLVEFAKKITFSEDLMSLMTFL